MTLNWVTVVKLSITAIYDEEDDELLTLPGEQLARKFKTESMILVFLPLELMVH